MGGAQGRAVCKGQEWQETGLERKEGRIPRCRVPSITIRTLDLILWATGNHRSPLIGR